MITPILFNPQLVILNLKILNNYICIAYLLFYENIPIFYHVQFLRVTHKLVSFKYMSSYFLTYSVSQQLTLHVEKKCYQKRQLKTKLELHLLQLFGNGFHNQYVKIYYSKWLFNRLYTLELLHFSSSTKRCQSISKKRQFTIEHLYLV